MFDGGEVAHAMCVCLCGLHRDGDLSVCVDCIVKETYLSVWTAS